MARFAGSDDSCTSRATRASVERAVNDELQFHFDMTLRELMANGMSADDARTEAERRFGDVQRTRERLATIDRARVGQRAPRRMVERVRAGPSLRAARAATQARLRARGRSSRSDSASARTRRCSASSTELLFRPPALLILAGAQPHASTFTRTSRGKENISTATSATGASSTSSDNTTSFDAMTPFYYQSARGRPRRRRQRR